jgi:hypothetical protein
VLTAPHHTTPQVITKGKAKLPTCTLEGGMIIEVGNWSCEFDQEVALEHFK